MKEIEIFIDSEEEFVPEYATEGAAGADLRAAIDKEIILLPGESKLVPTGIHVEIPQGYEMQIRPRSGLALKNQVTVLNTPGTIDSDYRGEVMVIMINHGKRAFTIVPKMRIGQIVLKQFFSAKFIRKRRLTQTSREGGGFGHTGAN